MYKCVCGVCVCVCVWRRNSLKSWWMEGCIFNFDGIAKLCAWGLDLRRLPSPGVFSRFQILAKVIGKKKFLIEFASPFSYRKVQHLCLCFQIICNSPLWTVHISAHFSVGLLIFFLLIYENIFYIRKMSSLSMIEVANIFPQFVICCFLLMGIFFFMQDFYVVEGINLFLWLSGVCVALRKYLANSLLCWDCVFLSPCDFFSSSFRILFFLFKTLIHLAFI